MPDVNDMYAWMLVLFRASALMFTVPVFDHAGLPRTAKVAFAGLLAWIALPQAGTFAVPPNVLALALVAGKEIAIGVMMGMAVRLIFAALDLAACGRSLDIAVESAATVVAEVDPHWLRQAIDALLSNGVRFTPDGGRVCLAASREGSWRRIEVTDTGIGIAPADIGTLFEPFSSAGGNLLLHGSGRLAFQARGLGLGLAMVKAIVEAHGGSVAVESAPGLGSRFTLRLPDGPA